MKVAIGSDHAGFELKEKLKKKLASEGHEVADFGADSTDSTDYPDYAQRVGSEVSVGRAERGILVCYTGVGMAMAANKIKGVRAAMAVNEDEVRLTREHNDANVLTIGAKFQDEQHAVLLTDLFLKTEFAGGRHARRVAKIAQLEQSSNECK
jgi:ribose 5-phosphate isomerase B